MVPNGWEVKSFEDIAFVGNGQVDPREEPYSSMWHIGPENVTSDTGRIKNIRRCSELGLISGKYEFDKNSIVYSKIRPNLNKVCRPNFDGVCSADMYPIWTKEGLYADYLFYYMLGPKFYSTAVSMSMRTGMPKINRTDLDTIKINIPPINEQQKIAKILSTWDEAISITERLIENSTQQKKALMQQLLTGKKRLLDHEGQQFEGEWKEVKLLDIGKCITGLTYSPDDVVENDGMLVLRSSNVQNGKLAFHDNVYVSSDLKVKSKTKKGDILVCVRNGSKNLIGKSALIRGRAENEAHGAFMTLYRCVYPDYIFQLFQSNLFYRQVNKNLGATINSINNSDLHKFKFLIPNDEEEIAKIATVLTNADREIELLEQQLADLQQEKKALMQVLLTGKVRVVVDGDNLA